MKTYICEQSQEPRRNPSLSFSLPLSTRCRFAVDNTVSFAKSHSLAGSCLKILAALIHLYEVAYTAWVKRDLHNPCATKSKIKAFCGNSVESYFH